MTVAMVLYLIMTFVFSRLLRFWESKLDGPASFDLATTDQLAHTSGNYSYCFAASTFWRHRPPGMWYFMETAWWIKRSMRQHTVQK